MVGLWGKVQKVYSSVCNLKYLYFDW